VGKFLTDQVMVRTSSRHAAPELLKKWLEGHVETTRWINGNSGEAKKILNRRINELTSRGLAAGVLDDAFGRMQVTYDPVASSLQKSADDAYALGFLRDKNIDGIYDLALLNQVLTEKGLKPLQIATAKQK